MRRFLLLFAMLFAFATNLSAQTELVVGNPASTTSSTDIPVNIFFSDAMSEILYLSTELQSGLITKISFYHNGATVSDGNLRVYLKETSVSSVGTGWLSPEDWSEVFSGPIVYNQGWVTIVLSSPFAYSGVENLAVGVIRDGEWFFENHSWKTTATSFISCVYHKMDYFDFDIESPSYYNEVSSNRPIAKFEIASLDGYCYPPMELTAGNVTQTSAELSWNATPSSTTFGVAYKLESEETWTEVTTSLSDVSYTLTELLPYSQYVAKVWSICPTGNSEEKLVRFYTLPTSDNYLALPYEQTFDDLDAVTGWQTQNNGDNGWFVGSATNNTMDEDGTLTPGNALYVSNDNGSNNTYEINGNNSTAYYSSLIDIQSGYNYGLEFDYKCVGEPNWDELRLFLVPFSYTLGDDLPDDEYEFGFPEQSATWSSLSYVLPEVEAGVYKLVFAWINDSGTGDNPPAAVDNIKIYATNCERPGLITAELEDMIGSVSMTLTVENPAEGVTGYLVEYKTETAEMWSSIESTSPIVINNLPYGAKILYRVTAICAEGAYSIPTAVNEIYTICDLYTELPYEEGFENPFMLPDGVIGNAEAPFCWFGINGGDEEYMFNQSDWYDDVTGTGCLYYSGIYTSSSTAPTSDWMISPRIELEGNQRLNFRYRNATSSSSYASPCIQVYAYNTTENDITSIADTADFVLLQTIYDPSYTSNEWRQTEVNLSQFSGNVRLAIAVRQGSRSFLIDDFVVSDNLDCPELFGFNVLAASEESVNVSYNISNIAGAGVTIAYTQAEPGDTVLDLTTATTINIPQDAELPYEITGLTAGETYLFMAAQACGIEFVGPVSVTIPVVYHMPFNADFDTEETTPVMEFATDNINAWFIGTLQNNTTDESGEPTNGGAMYISGDNGQTFGYITDGASTEATATVPVYFDEDGALEYVISFDYKVGGEGDSDYAYDYMSAYLVPAGGIANASNVLITNVFDNAGGDWNTVELSRGGLSGLYNLVFKWTNDGISGTQPAVVIDNISIEGRACAGTAVNATLAFVETETSATVVMNLTDAGNVGVTYNVSYPTEEGLTEVTGLTLEDFPYTIVANADYNTPYTASVTVVCADGASILVGEASIVTPCMGLELPWSETFSVSPFSSPCWTRAGALLPQSGVISSSSMEIIEDYWGLEDITLQGASSTVVSTNMWGSYHHYWLITPNIDLGNDGEPKQIAFDVALTPWGSTGTPEHAYDDRFIVFVSTDGGITWDINNALVFADSDTDTTYNFSDLTNSFQRYAFKLVDENDDPITGSVKFAFYAESTESNGDNMLYLDNIVVEEWSECQRPYNLSVSNITQTTAIASFSVFATSEWEYAIVQGEDLSSATAVTVEATNGIQLTDLTPGTLYTFAARSVCEESNSDWVTCQFYTFAQPAAVPYATSFNTVDNWFMADGSLLPSSNAWAIGTAVSIDEGSAAYISNDGGQTYAATAGATQTITYLYKDLDFGTTENDFEISFDWKAMGGDIKVYLTNIEDLPQAGLYPNAEVLADLSESEDWQEHRIYLGSVTGQKRLLFASSGYLLASDTPAAIDNVDIAVVTCAPPALTSVQAINITANSATITWTDNDPSHNSWNVYYKPFGTNDYEFVTTTTTSVDLTTLAASSIYNAYVTTMCGSEESVGTTEIIFNTLCGVIEEYPYFESFEISEDLGCWTSTALFGETPWEIVQDAINDGNEVSAADGNRMVYHTWYDGESSRLSTPTFDLTSLDYPYIKFSYQLLSDGGTHENLTVKYRTTAEGEWQTLENYTTATNTWVTDSILLPEPSATYQIGFESIGVYGYGVVVDAITVYDGDGVVDEPTPDPCDAPTALAANNITETTADITWTGTATSYEVRLNGGVAEAVSGTTKQYTGLTPNTAYTVEVRAVCEGQTSDWVSVQFTTLEEEVVVVTPPTVATLAASEITNASATLNATVTAGSEEITAQGFMYKATAAADWTTVAATGENMTATVEGLEAEMAYEYKAFATTESGTVEGEVMSFTTLAGLNDAETINAMIYPNPADDKAIISVSVAGAKIVVSDMQGRILLSDDMNESTYELNTSNYAAGVYYIRIISGNTVNTQKLIVK